MTIAQFALRWQLRDTTYSTKVSTPYKNRTLPDLTAYTLDTRQAEGQQVRSFQLAIRRLAKRPELAKVLIHKPGPLSDHPDRIDAYAEVYRRSLEEVGAILTDVRTAAS